jgi:glycosyltransferase involved in cell wall biosynthesis
LKKKIVLLSHQFYPKIGGIETVSEFLADSMYCAGYEVRLLTWSTDNTGKVFNYEVVRKPNFLQLIRQIAWADVVFENNPCMRLAWPNLFYNRPTIIALHTWISRVNGKLSIQDFIKLRWIKRAKFVISCSKAVQQRCWRSSLVIENSYKEELFRVVSTVPRTLDFVFLGRLVSDKGADMAIRALHTLLQALENKPRIANVSLTIIGEGVERDALEQLVKELQLQKNVVFKGTLIGEQLVQCLNQHRFLLVPSMWQEPFGLVVLEGMACGCIPIVSDSGGLPEAIGHAGLIFKRGDINSLVNCMITILQNKELEERIRIKAPSHLAAHTTKKVSEKYLSVLETVISSSS